MSRCHARPERVGRFFFDARPERVGRWFNSNAVGARSQRRAQRPAPRVDPAAAPTPPTPAAAGRRACGGAPRDAADP